MIFFANAEGTITRIIGEPIYQGSHKASRVVLVAPFSGVSVTVAFTLPNGVRTAVNLAEPNMGEFDLVGIYTQEGEQYNAWTYLLERSITEYAGTVSVQFFVYTVTGEVISTFTTSLTIQKGVPTVLPELPTATIYEQILEYLAKVETRLNNVILFVSQLPTININTGAVYIVQKSATNYNAYVYSPAISAWVQINKSVVNVPAVSYMTDESKIYYLTQSDSTNTVGLYGLIGSIPKRILTINDLNQINSTLTSLNTKVTQLETKVTTVESEINGVKADVTEAKTNAQTALNASNTANTNADNALEVANQALEKANSVTATFKPGGSIANISLLPPLTASNLGYVFDVADAFTTTADFLEGVGIEYPAGTNVAIIEPTSGVYKYDIFAGNFQPILESGVNIKTVNGKSILGSGDLEVQGANIIDIGTLTAVSETEFTTTITAENYAKLSEPAPVLKFVLAEGLEPSYVPMTNFGGTFIGAITFATTYNIDVIQITITSDYAVSAISKGTKRLMPTNEGQSPYNTNDYQPVVTINDGVDDNNKLWTKKTIGEITITTEQLQSYLQTYQVTLTIDQVNVFEKYGIVNVYALNEGQTAQILCGLRKKALESLNSEEIIFEESTYNADGSSFNIFTIDRNTNLLTQTNKSFNGVEANIANNTLRVFGYGELKMLPPVTASDSGKFLTVNNSGQWVATTVPNAETTSF